VNSFKYLGTVLNTDSSVEEKIKERIAAGNGAYRVHNRAYRVHNRAYRVHTQKKLFLSTLTFWRRNYFF